MSVLSNGFLLALTADTAVAAFDIDFLVIAGGGGGGDTTSSSAPGNTTIYHMGGGGGAGGYLNSFGTESSGGNSSTLATLNIPTDSNFTVTVGAGGAVNTNGSNSVFSGTDSSSSAFSKTATGGGRGAGGTNNNSASTGGSGGGGGWVYSESYGNNHSLAQYDGQAGTSNQGTAGGDWGGTITPRNEFLCGVLFNDYCFDSNSSFCAGGGGGAGSAGEDAETDGARHGGDGGDGLASSITGSSVTRAGGGGGETRPEAGGTNGSGGTGSSAAGGGGNFRSAGQNGTVILRYPNTVTISFDSAQLTGTTATVGNDKVTTFTAGSGTVSWS